VLDLGSGVPVDRADPGLSTGGLLAGNDPGDAGAHQSTRAAAVESLLSVLPDHHRGCGYVRGLLPCAAPAGAVGVEGCKGGSRRLPHVTSLSHASTRAVRSLA
jgi:hypothetical protein